MKKLAMILALLLLFAGVVLRAENAAEGQIKDLIAYDLENDDGSGIVLRWTPLSKEHRIIKYNIYRGVSPDSLFLLTDIEVDPSMGVLAPHLYYYDSGDQPLIEFETSPMRLKKEKGQPEGSPLYQKFPINSKILSSVQNSYTLLAMAKARVMYKKQKPVTQDDNTFSGLKLANTEGIYALLNAGKTYYYSVAALNEKGRVLPASELVEVIPIDDGPSASAVLFAAYIQDQKKLNFEWNPPVGSGDIAAWHGWLISKHTLPAASELPEGWQANAIHVFSIPNIYGNAVYYHSEEFDASALDLSAFHVVLSYQDYSGQDAAIIGKSLRNLTSDELPELPSYKVMDKKDDKGDGNLISFGKPIAYISQAEFKNRSHKVLRINYEVSKNENYTVDKVRFRFRSLDGEEMGEVIESYVDNVIELKLKEEYRQLKGLKTEIQVKLLGQKTWQEELITQEIHYNAQFRRFQPSHTYIDGVDANELYYDILHKSKVGWDFAVGLRSNALTRTYDHTIPYEDYIFKPIMGYDAASNRFLYNLRLELGLDADSGSYFDAPFYKEEFEKELQALKDEIAELESAAETDPENMEIMAELAANQAKLEYITKHPAFLEASSAKNEKAWRKIIFRWRNQERRSYQYKVIATDGKAAFQISDIYEDETGNNWFFPISNWFYSTKWMTLFATILFLGLLVYAIYITRRKDMYVRPIAGLEEIDNSIGRATEMGRPVMFVPGWGTIEDVCTIASLMILSQVAKKTAEYDTRLINPHCDYMVLPLAQEIISSSYSEMGRPDSYNQNDVFFISDNQFPFTAGVNGITLREKVATIFYMGFFNAEALLLTETGNQSGAIQVAATDAITQVPFFITTCDYTLIGEEFYAASAYLSHNPDMMSMLKTQDYFKIFIVLGILIGAIVSSFNLGPFIHYFPLE